MTAPSPRRRGRAARRPAWSRQLRRPGRPGALARRRDDRPGIERNASLAEVTMRSCPPIFGARF